MDLSNKTTAHTGLTTDTMTQQLNENYNKKTGTYYTNARREMVDFIPPTANTLLDVGCGNGAFGAAVKEEIPSCTVWGIEPQADAAEEAKRHLDKVINKIFDAQLPELADKKFDCLTFNDVLEHMPYPEGILLQCKPLLNKEGCIIASIPNILFFRVFVGDIILKQDWKYTQSGILDNTHLRFFTKKSMIRLFENSGYKVSRIEGINPHFPRYYKLLNFLLLNKIYDWRFMQFCVYAKLK